MQGNRPLVVILSLLLFGGVVNILREPPDPSRLPPSGIPSRVVLSSGYPEFRVDGEPFFIHGASFPYPRIPRDLWEAGLRGRKQIGINTIDLEVPWNWHQPTETAADFTGRTNPRRDLAGLLEMLADFGFKVVIRPGPFLGGDWRSGGYPGWLLEKPEFQTPRKDVLEGRYPFHSSLQYAEAERSAGGFLNNPTHLEHTRRWYGEVMEIVRPHLASRGGNVILVQIDGDQAVGILNNSGPRFWEYLNLLREYLREAARDPTLPVFFETKDMRAPAAAARPVAYSPFWAMDQFDLETRTPLRAGSSIGPKFAVERLKTQAGFPPIFIEYRTAAPPGAGDIRSDSADPIDSFLVSRQLLHNGAKGISYHPLQDTIFPAGFEAPWASRFSLVNGAFGLDAEARPAAAFWRRNGRLIEAIGPQLASAHYTADLGIVYTASSYPQNQLTQEDLRAISDRTRRALLFSRIHQMNSELVDIEYQTISHLRRYPLLLLPVPSASSYPSRSVPSYLELSARSQALLLEYVRQGGLLAAYPAPPPGRYLRELFPVLEIRTLETTGTIPIHLEGVRTAASAGSVYLFSTAESPEVVPYATVGEDEQQIVGYRRPYGAGAAITLGAEFDRFPDGDDATPRPPLTLEALKSSGQILEALLESAGATRSAFSPDLEAGAVPRQTLLALLSANQTTETGKGSKFGFLSILNLGSESRVFRPSVLDPRNGELLTLPPVHVAGRDALLLPLRLGLMQLGPEMQRQEALGLSDEIYYSTAEILGVRPSEEAIWMDLFGKGASSIRLRLNHAPSADPTADGIPLEYRYYPASRFLDLDIPPSRDPSGMKTIQIPYSGIRSVPGPSPAPSDFKVGLVPTVKIPVLPDLSYDLEPATRVAHTDEVLEFAFIHPPDCEGQCTARVRVDDLTVSEVRPESTPAFTIRAPSDRSYLRDLEWSLQSKGREYSGTARVLFFPRSAALAWERDLDRDGHFEYVLENDRLRLVVFPRAGARSFVLADKRSNTNLFTPVGAMREVFSHTEADPPGSERMPDGSHEWNPGLFNRPFEGAILRESGTHAEIRLRYDAPDLARLERIIRLEGESDYVDVTHRIVMRATASPRYTLLHSLSLGEPADLRSVRLQTDLAESPPLSPGAGGDLPATRWISLDRVAGGTSAAIAWDPGAFSKVEYECRPQHVLIRLVSAPWPGGGESHAYRVRYYYGAESPQWRSRLFTVAR